MKVGTRRRAGDRSRPATIGEVRELRREGQDLEEIVAGADAEPGPSHLRPDALATQAAAAILQQPQPYGGSVGPISRRRIDAPRCGAQFYPQTLRQYLTWAPDPEKPPRA